MSEHKEASKQVHDAVARLAEHFDSVQIFATRHIGGEESGLYEVVAGAGNYFTRIGHVRSWLIEQDEQARVVKRKEMED